MHTGKFFNVSKEPDIKAASSLDECSSVILQELITSEVSPEDIEKINAEIQNYIESNVSNKKITPKEAKAITNLIENEGLIYLINFIKKLNTPEETNKLINKKKQDIENATNEFDIKSNDAFIGSIDTTAGNKQQTFSSLGRFIESHKNKIIKFKKSNIKNKSKSKLSGLSQTQKNVYDQALKLDSNVWDDFISLISQLGENPLFPTLTKPSVMVNEKGASTSALQNILDYTNRLVTWFYEGKENGLYNRIAVLYQISSMQTPLDFILVEYFKHNKNENEVYIKEYRPILTSFGKLIAAGPQICANALKNSIEKYLELIEQIIILNKLNLLPLDQHSVLVNLSTDISLLQEAKSNIAKIHGFLKNITDMSNYLILPVNFSIPERTVDIATAMNLLCIEFTQELENENKNLKIKSNSLENELDSKKEKNKQLEQQSRELNENIEKLNAEIVTGRTDHAIVIKNFENELHSEKKRIKNLNNKSVN